MIRCLVVDDEAGAIEVLARYIGKTPGLKLHKSFRSALEALSYLKTHEADLVFLDIDMPELNGLRLGELVDRGKTRIIFCTAYAQFAVESYALDALDYLLKPVSFERFLKAVSKMLSPAAGTAPSGATEGSRPAAPSPPCLFVKSGPKILRLNLSDILYMEKDGHYIVFHTTTGQALSRMNMAELLAALPPGKFARVHKSFVVHVSKIDTIEKHTVIIRGKEIPISDGYREEFLRGIQTTGD
jgi:two-component system LytT family response regulator